MEKKYLSNAQRQKAYRDRLKQKAKSTPTEPPTAVESAPATFHELCKQAFEALAALTRPEPPTKAVTRQPPVLNVPKPDEVAHFSCSCDECRARYQAGYLVNNGSWVFAGVVSPTKGPSAIDPRYGDRDWGSTFRF